MAFLTINPRQWLFACFCGFWGSSIHLRRELGRDDGDTITVWLKDD